MTIREHLRTKVGEAKSRPLNLQRRTAIIVIAALTGLTGLAAGLGVSLVGNGNWQLSLPAEPEQPEQRVTVDPQLRPFSLPISRPQAVDREPQQLDSRATPIAAEPDQLRSLTDAGLILVLAVLLLGGGIATLGDRLGTKVGKARLSLFKLRPRQTATVVTILTGITVSATTLGVLFAASESLRDGIFKLDQIRKEGRRARQELAVAQQELQEAGKQKQQIERELTQSKAELNQAQTQLNKTQRSLKTSLAKLSEAERQQAQTQAKLDETQQQLDQTTANFRQAKTKLADVSQQAQSLRSGIARLRQEQQDLIQQRDSLRAQNQIARQKIADLDQAITRRDRTIKEREQRLTVLEKRQQFLETEVAELDQKFQISRQLFQELRRGNVGLLRNQVLYKDVVQGLSRTTARAAIDRILQVANLEALRRLRPGTTITRNEQIIQITNAEVERLIQQVDDGRPYVIRILSAGNYLVGEKSLLVFADIAANQLIFQIGEQVASTSADPATMTEEELLQRLNLLLAASQFRAQRGGVLVDDVEIDIRELTTFVEKLRNDKQPMDIKALAADNTYTAGPLRIDLVAMREGQVLFRSNSDVQ